MRHFNILKLLLIVGLHPTAEGQSVPESRRSRELDREVGLLNMDEGQYSEETAQRWIDLQENPLDLNHITREELMSLSLLSVSQINSFLRYIHIHGKLISIYELQAIPEFDLNTIRKILPMVTLKPSANSYVSQSLTKRIATADNHYLVLRVNKTLEEKSGFDKTNESTFTGSPYQWLVKYRSSHSKDFSVGLTMEKDAGEKFTWDPKNYQNGPDFWSFHLTLFNRGNIKNITLGDYKLQIGQGVLFAAGFYPGKGAETITTVRRSNLGIVPYTSTTEHGFLRGAAVTYQIGKIDLTTFYSNKLLDANLSFDFESATYAVSSLPQSGLHRTETEISQRKSLHEETGGINIAYLSRNKNLSLGQVLSFNKYSLAPEKSDKLYKRFDSEEKLTVHLGYNVSYNWENFNFFGEGVIGSDGKYGLVAGVLGSFSERVQSSFLFRKYDAGYNAPYGDAFSENSTNANESGFYWGLKMFPSRKLTITAFMDIFQFPWLKFRVDRPSGGNESLLAFTYKFARNLLITGLWRQEHKAINDSGASLNLNNIVMRQRNNYQLSFSNSIDDLLTLKTNLQWSKFLQAGVKTKGFSISQDLNIALGPLRLSNRIMLFETDNFDNRHYRYERDLLYALSLPALSGRGYRYYSMLQAKIARNISIWIKLARTIYFDRFVIGTGRDQIDAPQKTDVRCQIRYAF